LVPIKEVEGGEEAAKDADRRLEVPDAVISMHCRVRWVKGVLDPVDSCGCFLQRWLQMGGVAASGGNALHDQHTIGRQECTL
jgi:hypothetical protein